MDLIQIFILALVQGAAELLPVSSSAHVIVAEKLMGVDPTSPQATLLLVMLHTGTMLSVIVHYWKAWRETYFSSLPTFRTKASEVIVATIATAIATREIENCIDASFVSVGLMSSVAFRKRTRRLLTTFHHPYMTV